VNINHSKYKNTGLLFELLVYQTTYDFLKEGKSPALNLLKKYFVKGELGHEYRLYESILKTNNLNENKASFLLENVLKSSTKLNRSKLKTLKYNLVKEIKENYNEGEFFSTQIPQYKQLASIYTLIEAYNSSNPVNPNQSLDNQTTILEHLTEDISNKKIEKDHILEKYNNSDKDLKILTYKLLLEKFNKKYNNLNPEQKNILSEYINLLESTPKLKGFYNNKIEKFKNQIEEKIPKIQNKATKIKVEEVSKYLTKLDKKSKINEDHLVDLLQYSGLIKEIDSIHE